MPEVFLLAVENRCFVPITIVEELNMSSNPYYVSSTANPSKGGEAIFLQWLVRNQLKG